MQYEGEHLWIGHLGHFCTILSLVASLVAVYAYARSTALGDQPSVAAWRRLGRVAFLIDAVCVLAVFVILYAIIYNHWFEYRYAHQHSKRSLDVQYLLSCFWEGQEGSFMLWSFWNAVLGLIVIRTARQWEAPVMAVMSVAQVFLASFLIGIYFFDLRVGSSPFVLMREEFPQAPIFRDPQYLYKYLVDGNGLNILLQNYWMVIHPPVLFLGFSSTIVPYAYAIAGLWRREHRSWTDQALPWSLFSAGILGLGIMMGAAWAYESLTFGGYWAWDPVENASMVPWLLLVAGIHTMLIFRSTGHSLPATHLFIAGAHILVLYSTFLTRTGVLGDTSVHAFTGEGSTLYGHLLLMIAVFTAWPLAWYLRRRREVPVVREEEQMSSREFWMFIGSLLNFVSAVYIIILTSLPFFNRLFGSRWAIGEDVSFVYNRVMLLVAFVIAVLTATTQFLRYRQTPRGHVRPRLWVAVLAALAGGLLVSLSGILDYNVYGAGFQAGIHITLWASLYTVFGNAQYLFAVLKGKMKAAGASLAHAGFGLMLVGILISSAGKELVSRNRTGIAVPGLKDARGKDENPLENVTLIHRAPMPMGRYEATYTGDSTDPKGDRVYFNIQFREIDSLTGVTVDSFVVTPNAFLVKGEEGTQLSSNPGSKHYPGKDVFVYITSWLNPDNIQDTSSFRMQPALEGDTAFYSGGYVTLDRLIAANRHNNKDLPVVDSAWLAQLTVHASDGRTFSAEPAFLVKDGLPAVKTDTVWQQNLLLTLGRSANGQIEMGLRETAAATRYITLKAYIFPYINLLWLGTVLMVVGFLVSAWHRVRGHVRAVKGVSGR
ncbi:MAG: cytochrome c assembly protein [Bacteroidetes bacterium]|nr:cytochrome c assembly protein [Bacteroidota bacterium]